MDLLLTPVVPGITDRPFFTPGRPSGVAPLASPRTLPHASLLPPPLARLYAAYPPDVEFHDPAHEWTVLSENEVLRRYAVYADHGQERVVDVALRYAGMGWVHTCTYDPTTQCAATTCDGGGSGGDREANFAAKLRRGDDPAAHDFAAWWAARA